MKGKGPLVLGGLSLLLSITTEPVVAHADVVELKGGQRVEGTLKQATPASVSVEVGGQTITFEGDKVRAIYFGAAPVATSATPASGLSAAIAALKALRSVTQAGVTYRDYMTRVGDAKINVDRALSDAIDGLPKTGVSDAMELYVLAGNAGENRISQGRYSDNPGIVFLSVRDGSLRRLGGHPLVRACGAMQPLVDATKEKLRTSSLLKEGAVDRLTAERVDDMVGVAATQSGGTAALWSCAVDKIAEAEKLLGK